MDHCRRCLLLFLSAFWLWPAIGSAEGSVITMKPVQIVLPAEALRDLDIKLPLAGNLYKAEFLTAEPPSEGLSLGFFDPDTKADPRHIETSDFVRPGGSLHLRVLAERCCPAGVFERTVELVPQQGTAWPIHLPLQITVQGSFWTCHRPALVFLLVFGVGVLLNLYAQAMAAHSHFLSPRLLALRLRPLLWDGTGRLEEVSRHEVEALVRRDLTTRARILSWLRANPLVFGLPGGSYHETVELHLRPRKDVSQSRLSLLPRRNYHKVLQKEPHLGQGRLFATALQEIRFFAVPHKGRVGELTVQSFPQQETQPELLWLEPDQDLLRTIDDEDPLPIYAGWRIGGRA